MKFQNKKKKKKKNKHHQNILQKKILLFNNFNININLFNIILMGRKLKN